MPSLVVYMNKVDMVDATRSCSELVELEMRELCVLRLSGRRILWSRVSLVLLALEGPEVIARSGA